MKGRCATVTGCEHEIVVFVTTYEQAEPLRVWHWLVGMVECV